MKNLSNRQTTFVNGQAIDVRVLKDGDHIEFGSEQMVSFTFCQSQSVAAVAESFNPRFADDSLPIQPMAGDATVMWNEPPMATSVLRVVQKGVLRIGRAADNDVVLDAPGVSRRHAQLEYSNGNQPVISDLGSTNGTFVGGDALRSPRQLQTTDWITIGGYLLRVEGREIKKHDLSASHLTAFNVGKSYGETAVLQDVSIAFYPREFVGLMGASGCGKSTLMDALNGMRPATSGQVFVNDLDLYTNFDLLRRSIGYVPQRDVLHEALSVERTLYYAAKMHN